MQGVGVRISIRIQIVPENRSSHLSLDLQPFHFLSVVSFAFQSVTPCVSLRSIDFRKHRRSTSAVGDQVNEERSCAIPSCVHRITPLIDIQPVVMGSKLLGIRISTVNVQNFGGTYLTA